MRVTPALTVNDARLTSSTAAEPGSGEASWVPGSSYSTGTVVIRLATHQRYERLAPGGIDATLPEDAPDKWKALGPTNRWAMFDLLRNTQTRLSSTLTTEITPGKRVNALGLIGLYGDTVTVRMHVGADLIYERAVSLRLRNTTTWSQYLFGEFRQRNTLVLYDLPLASGAKVTVTITPLSGLAACGGLVLGTYEDLGQILDQPVSEVLNFSKIDRDEFGTATLVPRRNVPVLQHRVLAPSSRLDRLRELREQLNATPALWSGADDRQDSNFFDTLLVLGIAKRWAISLQDPQFVISDIQLEEI